MTIFAPPISIPLHKIDDTRDPSKVIGTLTLSAGGAFQSAETGQRVTIEEGDSDRLHLYTGDSFEAIPGSLRASVSGSGSTRTLQSTLFSPPTTGDSDGVTLVVRSESNDDSTFAPGVVFGYAGGSTQDPEFHLQNDFHLMVDDLGTVTAPAIGIGTNGDDGIFSPTDGQLGITLAGALTVRHEATRTNFDAGAMRYITIPVKTDTGDPASPRNGDLYVNTQDNKVRLFAESAWRDLATW